MKKIVVTILLLFLTNLFVVGKENSTSIDNVKHIFLEALNSFDKEIDDTTKYNLIVRLDERTQIGVPLYFLKLNRKLKDQNEVDEFFVREKLDSDRFDFLRFLYYKYLTEKDLDLKKILKEFTPAFIPISIDSLDGNGFPYKYNPTFEESLGKDIANYFQTGDTILVKLCNNKKWGSKKYYETSTTLKVIKHVDTEELLISTGIDTIHAITVEVLDIKSNKEGVKLRMLTKVEKSSGDTKNVKVGDIVTIFPQYGCKLIPPKGWKPPKDLFNQ